MGNNDNNKNNKAMCQALNTLYISTNLIITSYEIDPNYYSYFIDEKTEKQR